MTRKTKKFETLKFFCKILKVFEVFASQNGTIVLQKIFYSSKIEVKQKINYCKRPKLSINKRARSLYLLEFRLKINNFKQEGL